MTDKTKRNRNYEKTETAIINALTKLSKRKHSISDISVTELCQVANISRSTFYLHYSDINSIFNNVGDKFLETFSLMIDELAKKEVRDFSTYIKEVFNFISDSNNLIKIGLALDASFGEYVDGIKKHLETLVSKAPMLPNTNLSKDQILVEVKIVSSGIIDFFIELLKNKEPYDPDLYTKYINDFLNRWLISLTINNN